MNFKFSWQEQYLTRSLRSLVRYCSCHLNIKFISSHHRVISSIYEALGNRYRVCEVYSPEPRAEVYCFRLSFNVHVSKLVYYSTCMPLWLSVSAASICFIHVAQKYSYGVSPAWSLCNQRPKLCSSLIVYSSYLQIFWAWWNQGSEHVLKANF